MNNWKDFPLPEDINKIDMVDYLRGLNINPVSIKGNEYRYLSPLHSEVFPTFVVFRDSNTWKEGTNLRRKNLMEFGAEFHNMSIGDLLKHFAGANLVLTEKKHPENPADHMPGHHLTLISKGPLTYYSLASFLKEQRIPWDVGKTFCGQAKIEYNGKLHKAIAFENGVGGIELRNSIFQGHYGQREITFINQQASTCTVFLDFLDFLSYQSLFPNKLLPQVNYLILNSPGLVEKCSNLFTQHRSIQLYLPHNDTGSTITNQLCHSSNKFQDKGFLYQNYPNLNDWIKHVGQGKQQTEQHHIFRRSG